MTTLLLTTGIDTSILSTQTGQNFGIADRFQAGRSTAGGQIRRGLIKPDITDLLTIANATITAADLRLYMPNQLSVIGRNVMVHRALNQFFEGNQNGAGMPAGVDGSTYGHRNGNPSGLVVWTGGGGGGAGSDYATVATDTVFVDTALVYYTWNVLADVQAAYAGTITYYGWWVKQIASDEGANSSNKAFASYQFATSPERPLLTVEYTVAGLLPKLMQYGQYSGGTL